VSCAVKTWGLVIGELPPAPPAVQAFYSSGDACPGEALVTVIVPCYNGAPFLEEALASALAQTHPAVEVIVVDDGSTDSSPEIAQRLPVRYLRQENRGLSEARNRGIRESKGAYIIFLDADDRLLPDAAAAGLRALEARPDCAMAVGDHAFISAEGVRIRKSGKFAVVPRPYEALLKSNFIEMISSVLFRRSVFDQVGHFNAQLKVAEDYDLYLRIARVQPICCHSVLAAEYRMHGSNISHNAELMLTTTLKVLKSQEVFIRNDTGRQVAFRAGIRSWRKQYGRRLASELAASCSHLRMNHLRHKLLTLAAWYPQGLFMFPLLRLRPTPLRRVLR
jgi:cellulose synthase/poly-beta-1,6-N-acetylglucosamine synthase-like glycosyltransferase